VLKTVYILIGPKGSGKSHIGKLLEQNLCIKFLQVEPLAIAHIEQFGMPEGGLKRDGFDLEEAAIHEILAKDDCVIFEATGSSVYFASVLDNLGSRYVLKLIRLVCPLDVCFERVKRRSSEGQHFVPDEKVKTINEKAAAVELGWDLQIDNSGPALAQAIIRQFQSIM
jgi:shikimate kinase